MNMHKHRFINIIQFKYLGLRPEPSFTNLLIFFKKMVISAFHGSTVMDGEQEVSGYNITNRDGT